MTSTDDDDNIIERVGEVVEEVVDEILAEGLVPEEETPWERRARRLEAWTAIILALAAVATTWATFQASLWGEEQTDAQANSAILRSDANQAAARATTERIVDSEMWLAWLDAYQSGDVTARLFFRDRFSPELDAAQEEWIAISPIEEPGPDGRRPAPPGTPMDLDSYRVPSDIDAERLSGEAEDALAEAERASGIATSNVRMAVLFALSLFFAGIATKFNAPKTQGLLILASILTLVIGTIRMLILPQIW